jgi:hypothetical protein
MVAFTTPYHIGFGVDSYQAMFAVGGDDSDSNGPSSISFAVTMLNVFVDIPVPWLTFSVGTGWGEGKFDPDGSTAVKDGGAAIVKSTLSKGNLWQFYAQVGVPVFAGWEVHLGYREFRGRFKSSETRTSGGSTTFDTGSFSLTGQTSSIGVRYTF